FLRIKPAGVGVAVLLNIEQSHVKSPPRQPPQWVEHRFMFRRHTDDMVAIASRSVRQTANRQIVALGCPARKNDLPCFRRNAGTNRFTRGVNRLSRLRPKDMVDAPRVAELLTE